MRLNAPKKITFYVTLVLAVLGLLAFFGVFLGGFEFWFMLAAYVVLALGNTLKGF